MLVRLIKINLSSGILMLPWKGDDPDIGKLLSIQVIESYSAFFLSGYAQPCAQASIETASLSCLNTKRNKPACRLAGKSRLQFGFWKLTKPLQRGTQPS